MRLLVAQRLVAKLKVLVDSLTTGDSSCLEAHANRAHIEDKRSEIGHTHTHQTSWDNETQARTGFARGTNGEKDAADGTKKKPPPERKTPLWRHFISNAKDTLRTL